MSLAPGRWRLQRIAGFFQVLRFSGAKMGFSPKIGFIGFSWPGWRPKMSSAGIPPVNFPVIGTVGQADKMNITY
ncbi:MAG: hypothetical protein IPL59_10405 [Candidatus Competibacteraceae bacterium]|nr:hypothetical protein [Candidatus Competibacteraceae bacterium]